MHGCSARSTCGEATCATTRMRGASSMVRVCRRASRPTGVFALDKEQMDQLMAYHFQKYEGKQEISCPACMCARAAITEAGNSGISLKNHDEDDHDNHQTTCLQAFIRVQCQSKNVFKNGNINPVKVKLTAKEIEDAMSRASTAGHTPAVGTPSFNEDDEAQDTQVYQPGPQDGQNDDEMIEDPSVALNPKPKRGRGRPKGSKNKVSKARKATIGRIINGLHLVPKTTLEHVALIPEAAFRLVLPWYICRSCKG